MKKILYLPIFISFVLINCRQEKEIQSKFPLADQRIEKNIAGNQIDTFYIQLDKNRFIFASLFQMNIDIYIKILDPQNMVLQEIDNLTSGPEFISFTSVLPGEYKILVQPFNPMATAGRYSFGLEKNKETNNAENELVDQLFAEFDNDYRAGAAVAVVENGNIIYKNGFGIANFDNKTPIKPSTRLNICSIGKQFTAFAIALLEQQEKLSIDDDVHKYIPELYNFDCKITLANLLNHSSGLREIADLLEISGKRADSPVTKTDVLKLIYQQKELNFNPGSEYVYCNTGYILLAEIIERITNEPFMDWMTENIFHPLGMNDTYFFYDPDSFISDYAWSYTLDDTRNYKKEQLYKNWYIGAGNIFSTVEDMAKWLINFDYPQVGDEQIISRLKTNQISVDKDSANFYTFGRVSGIYKGLKYYWHGGGGYGYTAQIVHFPTSKFGIIILSNFIYSGVYGRARQIADIFLRDHFTSTKPVAFDYQNPYKPVKVDNKVLMNLPGKYLQDSGTIINITRESNGLFIESPGSAKVELYALSDSLYFVKEADIKFLFIKDNSDHVVKMITYQEGNKTISPKIYQLPEEFRELKSYSGKYYSEELNTFYQIRQMENFLVAQHDLNGTIRLTPVNKYKFKGDRWYFSQIHFDSVGNEFYVTNERVRNIRFKKVNH
jgi:CubicO group peptidase (beta-lactamase class C family)